MQIVPSESRLRKKTVSEKEARRRNCRVYHSDFSIPHLHVVAYKFESMISL